MRFTQTLLFVMIALVNAHSGPGNYSCVRGGSEVGVPLVSQKDMAGSFWQYQWGGTPYGSSGDISGVLQLVNGGTEPMWIRYAGDGIKSGEPYDWKPHITTPSTLNGNTSHPWNELGTNGMEGQGDGFRLLPGEYQLVPFSSSACWIGGSLGCGSHGEHCDVSPGGRGSGTDASSTGQPNTLFEWTAPGVWDASLVDGFGMPIKVEVDGCGAPFNGSPEDCKVNPTSPVNDPQTWLSFEPSKCPNPIINDDRNYVGCKSMCACQNNAAQTNQDTDPACPNMTSRSQIENQPEPPGGYCGCSQKECVQWLRDLFDSDVAGKNYCDAITAMAYSDSSGKRSVYCQAYDDNAGTRSYGNGVIKVTLCNHGMEWAKDKGGEWEQL